MKVREVSVEGDTARITLTKGKTTILDTASLPLLPNVNWQAREDGLTFYAQTNVRENGKQKKVNMHRLILGAKSGDIVDHINGDGLDNRLSNLRLVSAQQNATNRNRINRSARKAKGTTYHRKSKKYQAQIKVNGKNFYLGLFETEQEAHQAYAKASANLHGEYGSAEYIT